MQPNPNPKPNLITVYVCTVHEFMSCVLHFVTFRLWLELMKANVNYVRMMRATCVPKKVLWRQLNMHFLNHCIFLHYLWVLMCVLHFLLIKPKAKSKGALQHDPVFGELATPQPNHYRTLHSLPVCTKVCTNFCEFLSIQCPLKIQWHRRLIIKTLKAIVLWPLDTWYFHCLVNQK